MSNEALFLFSALVDVLFVFIAARLGKEWMYATIAVNLILVGIFGAKLINALGFTTNVGNVYYACVFLATYFLIEQYGEKVNLKTILFGTSFVLFFGILSQLVIRAAGSPLSEEVNAASSVLFSFSPRVFFASILAFVFAQHVNISLYQWLKKKTKGKYIWFRCNAANIAGQFVDSALFFTIAFVDLPGPILIQAILVGWLLKTLVVFAGTPLLYLNVYLDKP
jgi:queuosine precursor transporter